MHPTFIPDFVMSPPANNEGFSRLVILAGLLLVAINLRPAITSVPPIIETIRIDLALSYASVSLLTVIPILCMSIFALTTPRVVKLLGREQGIFWALGLVAIATLARTVGDHWGLLVGSTILVGIGIAIGQTILPSIVKSYFPDRIAFATGLYTAALAIGATLGSILTVPLQLQLGTWTVALAAWGVLALVGVAGWLPIWKQARERRVDTAQTAPDSVFRLPVSRPLAWLLTLFMGVVANFFFITITWLPARFVAIGWTESQGSVIVSVFIVAGLIGMLSISAFGDRFLDRRWWIWGMLSLVIIGSLPIGLAPSWSPWLTTTVFGIGSGGLFTLALMLPADYAADGLSTDRLSAMVFAGGYCMAAIGPYAFGRLLDLEFTYGTLFSSFAVAAILIAGIVITFTPERTPIAVKA